MKWNCTDACFSKPLAAGLRLFTVNNTWSARGLQWLQATRHRITLCSTYVVALITLCSTYVVALIPLLLLLLLLLGVAVAPLTVVHILVCTRSVRHVSVVRLWLLVRLATVLCRSAGGKNINHDFIFVWISLPKVCLYWLVATTYLVSAFRFFDPDTFSSFRSFWCSS